MQMALDLETISETYFSGLADPTPQGFMNNAKVGIGTPFEEWPEEIKQLAANYWREIGVEVEIQPIDGTQHTVFLHENSSDGMVAWTSGLTYDAIGQTCSFTTESIWNPVAHEDSEYDSLWEAANAASSIEEQNRLLKAANMRIVEAAPGCVRGRCAAGAGPGQHLRRFPRGA